MGLYTLTISSIQYSVQVKQLQNPDIIFETIIGLVIRLAEHGLIHCDFNEFNIMVRISSAVFPCLKFIGIFLPHNFFAVCWKANILF